MEPETQKIITLLEETVQLQKTSYNNSIEMLKKTNKYKKMALSSVVIAFVVVLYAAIISVMYYYK